MIGPRRDNKLQTRHTHALFALRADSRKPRLSERSAALSSRSSSGRSDGATSARSWVRDIEARVRLLL